MPLNRNVHWFHFPKCGGSFASAIAGFICQSAPSPKTDPKNAQRECHWCGYDHPETAPRLSHYWEPKILPQMDFNDLPYCNWNQIKDRGDYYFQNHFPGEYAPSLPNTQFIGLFRDPRKRLVSAWNSKKHGTTHMASVRASD